MKLKINEFERTIRSTPQNEDVDNRKLVRDVEIV